MILEERHTTTLDRANEALLSRTFFAVFPEHPKAYDEQGMAKGLDWFNSRLGNIYDELLQDDVKEYVGAEVSPYTQEQLNIKYPALDTDTLVQKSYTALKDWRYADAEARAAVLVDSLERIRERFFDIAFATMHTTGQSFMMSFQASGPHALDRAMEAIAIGYKELTKYPSSAEWEKPMGKFSVKLQKKWKAISRGVSLAIGCSTFPVWNTVPGVYASLVTGNTVIIKPHPGAILPIAIVVAEIQKTLAERGYSPEIVQLAPDTADQPITKDLAEHSLVKIIDYTGSTRFGNYVESLPGKTTFTEKAGINSVIIDSVADIDSVMQNLAFAASLYSGQMCTAPQNIFIPEEGIKAGDTIIGYEAVVQKFTEALQGIANNPKMGPGTLGAIQNPDTLERIADSREFDNVKVLLDSQVLKNEEFPNARSVTPLVLEVESDNRQVFCSELFGPIVLIIKTRDTKHSVALAREIASTEGAISCGAYTTSEDIRDYIEREMEQAFTPVSFNLTGPIWMNQNAAFSDFHVTGGNPSGNATFTDTAYVVRRFVWVGHKQAI